MYIKSIRYHIDSGISIFCATSGQGQDEYLTPDQVRYIIVNYDISLVRDPLKKVKEQCKIYNRNITFQDQEFVLFFPLDNVIKPNESQITFRSLFFFLHDGSKISVPINATYSFIELQKNNITTTLYPTNPGKNHDVESMNPQEGESCSQPFHGTSSSLTSEDKDNTLFVDSLHTFKEQVKKSELFELIKTKEKTLDFNLKNFGISLLCKLLLLVKYVNTLVDNEFQEDLHKYLMTNILEEGGVA
ncbi:MAG: hypothetical protein ACFFE4_01560 [Candidatus Thorarchaeota archaeon]